MSAIHGTNRNPSWMFLVSVLACSCQVVLGLEDHQLGELDASTRVTTGGSSAISNTGGSGGQSTTGGSSSATSGGTGCQTCDLKAALVHRYSFDGSGTAAQDSIGSAHGTVVGTQLSGSGAVDLAGAGQYVDLPNGIVSSLTSATFETWVSWKGGSLWQRIFDFGSSDAAEGTQGTGVTYLFMTPAADNQTRPRFIYSTSGISGETRLNSTTALPTNTTTQLALVIDATAHVWTVYLNGTQCGSGSMNGSLSALNDVNNWLGHSQFAVDPYFTGSFYEFRIYKTALSASQLQLSNTLGPDTTF